MKKYQFAILVACMSAGCLTFGCKDDDFSGVASHVNEMMRRCEGDVLQQFSEGEWSDIETCVSPKKCQLLEIGTYACSTNGVDINTKPVVCKAGVKVCQPDRKSFSTCSADGTEDVLTVCGEGEYCNNDTVSCESQSAIVDKIIEEIGQDTCEADETICSNNALIKCGSDGKWDRSSVKICNEHEECLADGLDDCFCDAGAAHCYGNVLVECGEDYLFHEEDGLDCGDDYICDAKAKDCVEEKAPECAPTAVECMSNTSYRVCNERGFWDDAVFCKANEACSAGACIPTSTPGVDPDPITKECEPGEKKCFGSTTYAVCDDDGFFTSSKRCSRIGQTCIDGECEGGIDPETGEELCKTGQSVCIGNFYKTCKAGEWSEATSCGDQTCENGACVTKTSPDTGKDCKIGERKCADGGYLICTSESKWSTVQSCGDGNTCRDLDGSCVADVTTTECVGGQKRCINDSYYSVCKNGVFTGSQQCNSRKLKCYNGECLTCEPGSTSCNNNKVRTCKADGSGYDETSCDHGCSNGACIVCNDNEFQCNDKAEFQHCVSGQWSTLVACDAAACSASGTLGCTCTVGAQKCDADGNILECKTLNVGSGRNAKSYQAWQIVSACGSASACVEANNAVSCSCNDGDKRCASDGVQTCQGGIWKTTEVCDSTMTCDDTTKTCRCEEGTYKCNDTVTTGTGRAVCKNGAWDNSAKCGNNTACNAAVGGACIATMCKTINTDEINKILKQNRIDISIENTGIRCDGANLLDCTNGIYSVKKTCTSGCTALGEIAVCMNNAQLDDFKDTLTCNIISQNKTRCGANNTSIDKCTKTGILKFEFQNESCEAGQVCVEKSGSASCQPKVCVSAELVCDGTKVKQCRNNELKDLADCADMGMTCANGACVK